MTISSTRVHRANPRRSFPLLQALVGVCVFLAGVSLTLWATREEAARVEATETSQELADPILELCVQGGTVARALASEGKCALAEQVSDEPIEELPSGPDRDEIARLIEAEVAQLALPPGRGPTSGQLQEAAREVVLANPDLFRGLPGPEVSEVRLAAVVNAYFEANPPPAGPMGDAGPAGQTGDTGPRGPEGEDGEPPAGWVTVYPDGAREDCRRADPFDPAAPRYSCTFVPAPTTETPPPTTGPVPEPPN